MTADELPLELQRVHMVGIGGAGMSGIARILLDRVLEQAITREGRLLVPTRYDDRGWFVARVASQAEILATTDGRKTWTTQYAVPFP